MIGHVQYISKIWLGDLIHECWRKVMRKRLTTTHIISRFGTLITHNRRKNKVQMDRVSCPVTFVWGIYGDEKHWEFWEVMGWQLTFTIIKRAGENFFHLKSGRIWNCSHAQLVIISTIWTRYQWLSVNIKCGSTMEAHKAAVFEGR
jgi:hypothetical protein